MSYQQITLVGCLGKNPELRYLPDGRPVTNFSMATNRKWANKKTSELMEETTWWRISVFGPQAEACAQYLAKGRQVLVTGRMRPDPATGSPRVFTRNDGSSGASHELTATSVQFLGSRADAAPDAPAQQTEADSEGVPF